MKSKKKNIPKIKPYSKRVSADSKPGDEWVPVKISVPLIPRYTKDKDNRFIYDSFESIPVRGQEIKKYRESISGRGRKYGSGYMRPSHVLGRIETLVRDKKAKNIHKAFEEFHNEGYVAYQDPKGIKKICYKAKERLKPVWIPYEEDDHGQPGSNKGKVYPLQELLSLLKKEIASGVIRHPGQFLQDIQGCCDGGFKPRTVLSRYIKEMRKLLKSDNPVVNSPTLNRKIIEFIRKAESLQKKYSS